VLSFVKRHPRLSAAVAVVATLISLWGVKLVQVARGVDQARVYWSQPRGEPGGLLYVALGDSAAQGIGASSPDRGYVGLLAERLRQETGAQVQVVNLSASGARIDDVVRDQLPLLRELSPDIVTVAVGGNDVRDLDPDDFARRVAALTSSLPDGTLMADVPYFMHGRWQRDAEAAAQVVRDQAAAAGLVAVPLHEAQRARGWSAMITDFSADWFHPNDRGHRVWADAFWSALQSSPVRERLR
jgi:acyl-CoA thioesterase I